MNKLSICYEKMDQSGFEPESHPCHGRMLTRLYYWPNTLRYSAAVFKYYELHKSYIAEFNLPIYTIVTFI
jgi:hypothetical protein